MVKARHVPPSRKRYEERNPTVSVRVSRELKEQLQEAMEKTGKSYADILKEGLGVQKPITKKAYDKGYSAGYNAGKKSGITEGKKFSLGKCMVCNQLLSWDLERENDRFLIAGAITKAGYVHEKCA